MSDRGIVLAVAFLALTSAIAPVHGKHPPPNAVISQVQVQGEEFVEICNPTDRSVDLTGWYWYYFPATRTAWDDPSRKREFPTGATIPPDSFYLVQVSGELPIAADWSIGYRRGQLSDKSGTVAIFNGPPSAGTFVDAVGWGKDALLREGSPARVPQQRQSIVRRLVLEKLAPCQDTDDNGADFEVQAIATPRSSRDAGVMMLNPEAADAAFGETIPYIITIRCTVAENALLWIGAEDDLGWRLSLSTESLPIAAGGQVQLRLVVTLPVGVEFVALDLETTGLNPAEDEIIEIAWVRFEADRIVESFSSLVRPQQSFPARITELTGISPDDVALAPPIEEVLPGVLAALFGRTVVAHNASFDREFLEAAARRTGLAVTHVSWVDTLEAAKRAWPGLPSYSLFSLRDRLGLLETQEHRALPDAKAAGLVWLSALSVNTILLWNTITVTAFAEGATSPCAVATARAQVGR